ncbi:MAG: Crp/Fnr family transcriptional regulator [Betaproteobacteria bacterium]|nr:Crp/Fnr family transcriptional regulator [Betaproteobacteria bacterium]
MNTHTSALHPASNRLFRHPYSLVKGGLAVEPPDLADDRLRNRLLAGFPDSSRRALLPHLERVEMAPGDVICQYGKHAPHVYFPVTSIVSLVYDMEDGAAAEVAIVGNEGMLGLGLLMSGEAMPGLAEVRCAGHGYRLSARMLKQEFDRSGPLQHLLLCYAQAFMVEVAQNAACSRRHSIRQQLCHCLLASLDRSAGTEMALTHEMIAASLGVRRECVTVAAGKLRADALIEYRRGHITVLDRKGLEAQSCECHGVVKQAFDRLLPRVLSPVLATLGGRQGGLRLHAPQPKQEIHYLRAMK